MKFNFSNDTFEDYYFVMENETVPDAKVQILSASDKPDTVNFIRFNAIIQDFPGTRNRNKRLWKKEHVKQMLEQPHVQELIRNKSFSGEAGHPTATTGQLTIERLLQINPNNTSHRILSYEFKGNDLHAVIETLDQGPSSPGIALMKNVIQGLNPAFSARTMVPQRRNPDGTIDVLGAGRMICYDRVYLPGHEKAYKDMNTPVSQIVSQGKFDVIMESFADYVMNGSEKVKSIIDDLSPVMESVSIDVGGDVSLKVDGGRVIIRPEIAFRKDLRGALESFNF